jgi:hypothetical protein
MEEQYGQALDVEHPRLAGIFSDHNLPQVQCAPGATAEVCSGNKALTLPDSVVT